jgi:hypothetical protein
MPRRLSRRRLAVAALLVALAVLPHLVQLRAAIANRHNPQVLPAATDNTYPTVAICFLGGAWPIEAPSIERARWIGYRWEQHRRYAWVLALLAGLIVVREFLPIPRLFGREDD